MQLLDRLISQSADRPPGQVARASSPEVRDPDIAFLRERDLPPQGAPESLPDESEDFPITVGDLLNWPEAPLVSARAALTSDDLDRVVGWPVLWQPSSPPPAVSHALVLMPTATLHALGDSLPEAVAALQRAGVAALVLDPGTVFAALAAPPLLVAPHGIDDTTEHRLLGLLHAHRTRLYRRRYALERALTDSTLHGRPRADLLRLGAAQLGRAIHLLDERGASVGIYGLMHLATGDASPTHPPAPPAEPRPLAELTVRDSAARWLFARLATAVGATGGGWLAIGGSSTSFDEGDRLILARLAAVYAATLPDPPEPDRGDLVARLLRPGTTAEERLELAESLRLRPDGTFAVVRLALPVTEVGAWPVVQALQQGLPEARVRCEIFTDSTGEPEGLLLHTDAPEPADALAAVVEALARRSDGALLAVSGHASGLDRLRAANEEARYCLALLRAELVPGPLVDWRDGEALGPYRALYPLWGAATTTTFVRDTLGELLQRDDRQIGELLQTLLAFVRHSGNAGAAATLLAIHRNTLSYRLRQIDQLTGRSPYDPAQLLSLALAALLWTLPAPLASAPATD